MASREPQPWRRTAMIGIALALSFVIRSISRSGGSAHETHPAPRPAAVSHGDHDFGFEPQDTRVASLAWVMVVSVVVIASSVALLFGVIRHLRASDDRGPVLTSEQAAAIEPPGPALQADPDRDLAQERQREQNLLATYGWVDPAHTMGRIPIDRAMTLVIGKSLDPAP